MMALARRNYYGRQLRRGDSNADGVHDISDAVFTLLHLFGGGSTSTPRRCCRCQRRRRPRPHGRDLGPALALHRRSTASDSWSPGHRPDPTADDLTCEVSMPRRSANHIPAPDNSPRVARLFSNYLSSYVDITIVNILHTEIAFNRSPTDRELEDNFPPGFQVWCSPAPKPPRSARLAAAHCLMDAARQVLRIVWLYRNYFLRLQLRIDGKSEAIGRPAAKYSNNPSGEVYNREIAVLAEFGNTKTSAAAT